MQTEKKTRKVPVRRERPWKIMESSGSQAGAWLDSSIDVPTDAETEGDVLDHIEANAEKGKRYRLIRLCWEGGITIETNEVRRLS